MPGHDENLIFCGATTPGENGVNCVCYLPPGHDGLHRCTCSITWSPPDSYEQTRGILDFGDQDPVELLRRERDAW